LGVGGHHRYIFNPSANRGEGGAWGNQKLPKRELGTISTKRKRGKKTQAELVEFYFGEKKREGGGGEVKDQKSVSKGGESKKLSSWNRKENGVEKKLGYPWRGGKGGASLSNPGCGKRAS